MADKKKLAKYRKKLAAIEYPWQMSEVSQDDREKAIKAEAERRWQIHGGGVTDVRHVPDLLRWRECFEQGAKWADESRPGGAPDPEPWEVFDPESGDARRTATREQAEAYLPGWPASRITYAPRGGAPVTENEVSRG